MVQQTEFGIEQPSPYHGYCRRGRYHGQEKDCAVSGNAFHLPVQQNSQNQGKRNGERNFHDGVFKGVKDRLPHFTVAKQPDVVFYPNKDIAFAEIASLKKALIDRLENRDYVQDDQSDHGGKDEEPSPHKLVALPAGSFFNIAHKLTPSLDLALPPGRGANGR